jgi:4'-phosphopantetheinyl transferase
MQIIDPGPLAGEVHIWHGRISRPAASADFAVLSDAERARAARFVRPDDRIRFVVAHAAQRRLLARYLGTDPAAIRFGRSVCCKCGSGEHGRPVVEWPVSGLDHNLSGSGGHWLLAVAAGGPVGVDIECHRGIDHDRMAEACLTEAERRYLRDQPPQRQEQVFYRCWTRKEAVLKACGVGLAAKLTGLEVHPAQAGPVEVHHSSGSCPGTWLVQDVAGTADWSAAAAQPAACPAKLRFFGYGPDEPDG